MCGIIGRVGSGDVVRSMLTGLENLEYRGYDSAGIAVSDGSALETVKQSGTVDGLVELATDRRLDGRIGIGHTRWSTHGPPTDANAHPHTDDSGTVAVVHNGIIDNYTTLKASLQNEGYTFTSETDTEVIPHLVRSYLDEGCPVEVAFRRAVADIEGSYAVAGIARESDAIYAARDGSPLVVGVDTDGYFLASDVPAFLEYTDEVRYLEDGDIAICRPGSLELTDETGAPVSRPVQTVEWDPEETAKGEFDHFMLKEIMEQPSALAQTVEGRIAPEDGTARLDGFEPGAFEAVDSVVLVGCGTSYHAALYGAIALRQAGVQAAAVLANEYSVAGPPVDDSSLVVAVTQSGETADTLDALSRAVDDGVPTVTVTNVVGSSAARIADETVLIRAGPEIGVAATKTFCSQAVVLTMLAERIAADTEHSSRDPFVDSARDIDALPKLVNAVTEDSGAASIANRYREERSYFFIGRGFGYPVALEGALKFKEITYEHAEGFASGELKHGPLALITAETPVFAIFTGQEDDHTLKNVEEAATRGAPIVAVCPEDHAATAVADDHLWIPSATPTVAGVLATVQLQLVSYHAANLLDRSIDKPRNLAKSVTVK